MLWASLLAGTSLGAPLAPYALSAPAPPPSRGTRARWSPTLDVALALGVERAWLSDDTCRGDGCDTVRATSFQSAELGVQLLRPVGAYLDLSRVRDSAGGIAYEGEGYGLGAGLRFGVPVGGEGSSTGVHAWAELSRHRTESTANGDAVQRWQAEAGAALRAGSPLEGLSAWIGADVVPWTDDRSRVLDSTFEIALRPTVPVEAIGGVLYVSESLAGPWTDRGRLTGGLRGSVGYRTGFTGFLGAVF